MLVFTNFVIPITSCDINFNFFYYCFNSFKPFKTFLSFTWVICASKLLSSRSKLFSFVKFMYHFTMDNFCNCVFMNVYYSVIIVVSINEKSNVIESRKFRPYYLHLHARIVSLLPDGSTQSTDRISVCIRNSI